MVWDYRRREGILGEGVSDTGRVSEVREDFSCSGCLSRTLKDE